MKRKKTNIALITSLIVIWGAVIYRIVTYKKEHHYSPGNINQQQNTTNKKKFVDTFDLLLNYPDPFLTSSPLQNNRKITYNTNIQKVQSTKKTETIQHIQNNSTEKFPEIIYSSYVEKDGNLTAIIQMNGKKYLVEQIGEVNNVKILNISKEYIKVKWKNELKLIYKI